MNNDTPERLAASTLDAVLAAYGHDPVARDVLALMPTVRGAVIRAIIAAYGTGLATGATLAIAGSPLPKKPTDTPAPEAGRE